MIQNNNQFTLSTGERFYKLLDGYYVPSVTTILGANKSQGLIDWEKNVGLEEATRIKKAATDKGTFFHSAAEAYLKNRTVPDTKNLVYKELFNQAKPFLDHLTDIQKLESFVYSSRLGMAGTVDCIARLNNKPTIVDFKTSGQAKELYTIQNYFLQATAYGLMYSEMTNRNISQIAVAIFSENEVYPQIFIQNPKDYIKPLLEAKYNYYKQYDQQSTTVQNQIIAKIANDNLDLDIIDDNYQKMKKKVMVENKILDKKVKK